MPTTMSAIFRAFVEHLRLGVQARHLVINDGDADRVVAAGNVTVKHGRSLLFWSEFAVDQTAM